MLMKIFNTISSKMLVIASQKLLSRIVFPFTCIHNNRDIFYNEMVLIFLMIIIAKLYVKSRVAGCHCYYGDVFFNGKEELFEIGQVKLERLHLLINSQKKFDLISGNL